MPYVYSTLTNDQRYTIWETGDNGLPVAKASVLIKGGSNLANKNLITPRGVTTRVTASDIDILKQVYDFQLHQKNGFMVIREDEVDPIVVVGAGMKHKDQSAPLTPESDEFRQSGEFSVKPMDGSKKDTAPKDVQA